MFEIVIWALMIAGSNGSDNLLIEYRTEARCQSIKSELKPEVKSRATCIRFVKLEVDTQK